MSVVALAHQPQCTKQIMQLSAALKYSLYISTHMYGPTHMHICLYTAPSPVFIHQDYLKHRTIATVRIFIDVAGFDSICIDSVRSIFDIANVQMC